MTNLIIELSKYAFIILIALYTFLSFSVLKKRDQEEIDHGWRMQNFLTFLIHLLAYAVIYLKTGQLKFLVFYLLQFVLLQAVLVLTRVIYPMINQLVLNNMCFLLAVGFIILTRLNYDKAVRQFQMAAISLIFAMVIPVLVRKCLFLQNIPWIYGGAGLVILAAVAVFGDTTSGAKLSLNIGPVALQPSEFIKISFVFFVAARLAKSTVFKEVVLTTILAALHVIVLVLSKDLGGALLFFVTYLVMLYVATRKKIYFLAGMGA